MQQGNYILVVDDDRGLAELVKRKLGQSGYLVEHSSTGSEALEQIEKDLPELILVDYQLSDMTCIELFGFLKKYNQKVPFIVITGRGDEKIAVELMKLGALDYVVKDYNFTTNLVSAVNYHLQAIHSKQKKFESEIPIDEKKNKYQEIIDLMPDMIFVVSRDGSISFVNSAFTIYTSYCYDEWKNCTFFDLFTEKFWPDLGEGFQDALKGNKSIGKIGKLNCRNFEELDVEISFIPFDSIGNNIEEILVVAHNISGCLL